MSTIRIADRPIGQGHPVYCVAELSGEHCHDYFKATALIRAAHEAGADAVKVQVFTPDAMTLDSDDKPFWITWQGQFTFLYNLYADTAMPLIWHESLKAYAESLGMAYFASVFDQSGLALCERLGMPAYKIASYELPDTNLIRAVANTGKPVILSTGMATWEELQEVDHVIWNEMWQRPVGTKYALLKCTSAYPASPTEANLHAISALRDEFRCPIGLSDHTLGIAVPVAAVALGACIVEKHLTLARADGGPDAAFSLEPDEFKQMVDAVRVAEKALGTVRYGPTESERESLRLRRSLWVVADVVAGERFTPGNVRSLRPADGLAPKHFDEVMGRRATRDVRAGEPLDWGMVDG